MKYDVTLDDHVRSIEVRADGDAYRVSVDGGPFRAVSARAWGATSLTLQTEDLRRVLEVALDGEQVFVLDGDTPRRGTVVDPRDHALDLVGGAAAGTIQTQMPGAVVRVPVAVGDTVEEGQVVIVVEAMKMENEFKAPFDGVVAELPVSEGQAVESGATLVVIEADEA